MTILEWMKKASRSQVVAVVGTALVILGILLLLAAPGKQQADFFECPPNNHVVACTPGTTLTGCEAVGSGETTLELVDCQ